MTDLTPKERENAFVKGERHLTLPDEDRARPRAANPTTAAPRPADDWT